MFVKSCWKGWGRRDLPIFALTHVHPFYIHGYWSSLNISFWKYCFDSDFFLLNWRHLLSLYHIDEMLIYYLLVFVIFWLMLYHYGCVDLELDRLHNNNKRLWIGIVQDIYFIEILLELFNCVTVLKYLILSFLFCFVYRSFNFQYKKYNFDLMIFFCFARKIKAHSLLS